MSENDENNKNSTENSTSQKSNISKNIEEENNKSIQVIEINRNDSSNDLKILHQNNTNLLEDTGYDTNTPSLYSQSSSSNINYIEKSNEEEEGILNKNRKNYFYAKIGNTYTFFSYKNNGSPLIVIGPHWPLFLGFNSFITIGFICFFYNFWNYLNFLFKILGIFTYCLFFFSYTLTSILNPGIPIYDKNAKFGLPREKYQKCRICKIWVSMEKKTNHCDDCNVCVEGYDHHCPWTGKCIGKNNTNYFYAFIVSILFIFGYLVCGLTQAQNSFYKAKKKHKNKLF